MFAALGQTPPDAGSARRAGGGAAVAGTAQRPGARGLRPRQQPTAPASRAGDRPAAPERVTRRSAPREQGRSDARSELTSAARRLRSTGVGGRRARRRRWTTVATQTGGGGIDAGTAQSLSPEERAADARADARARIRSDGADAAVSGGRSADQPDARRRGRALPTTERGSSSAAAAARATTIDALFGPLPLVESDGPRVASTLDKQLKPVRLRSGITDGQNTELIEGDCRKAPSRHQRHHAATKRRPAATNAFPGFGQPARVRRTRRRFGGGGGGGNRGGGAEQRTRLRTEDPCHQS